MNIECPGGWKDEIQGPQTGKDSDDEGY